MSDAHVLRELFEELLTTEPYFPAAFYARLFAAHPEVRPLFFRSSPEAQQNLFAQKLILLADVLDQPEKLRSQMHAVRASHQTYGVTREMYAWVGEALVASVTDALGDRLTEARRNALIGGWKKMTAMVHDEP